MPKLFPEVFLFRRAMYLLNTLIELISEISAVCIDVVIVTYYPNRDGASHVNQLYVENKIVI